MRWNKSGHARTRDDLMPVATAGAGGKKGFQRPGAVKKEILQPRKGPGQYRVWTGEAICKAASVPVESSYRTQQKPDGGSHGHAAGCSFLTADLIDTQQERGSKRRREASLVEPFEFYMTNNMFDETKL